MFGKCRPTDGSDADAVSQATALDCSCDEGRTKQEFAEECDINTIIRRFGLGYEPPENVRVPLQGEFYDVPDFRSALDLVREADEAFMQMHADVRKRFDHDPVKFVEFVSDPKNVDECRKLGLAMPAAEPDKPVRVEVVPGAPAASAAA